MLRMGLVCLGLTALVGVVALAQDVMLTPAVTPTLPVVAIPVVEVTTDTQYMTGTQQFWLAMVGQFIALFIGMVTIWRKTESTHVLVNSELTQFKKLLGETALKEAITARAEGVREGRDQEQDRPHPPAPSDNVRVAVAEARKDDAKEREDEAKANLVELTKATENTVDAAEKADTIAKKTSG